MKSLAIQAFRQIAVQSSNLSTVQTGSFLLQRAFDCTCLSFYYLLGSSKKNLKQWDDFTSHVCSPNGRVLNANLRTSKETGEKVSSKVTLGESISKLFNNTNKSKKSKFNYQVDNINWVDSTHWVESAALNCAKFYGSNVIWRAEGGRGALERTTFTMWILHESPQLMRSTVELLRETTGVFAIYWSGAQKSFTSGESWIITLLTGRL